MKLAAILLSVAMLCFFLKSNGQSPTSYPVNRPVLIGHKVPDVFIGNIHFYKAHKIRLSTVGVKLVILNFWDMRHPAGIKRFPQIETLQEQFKNDVQFMNVTWQSENQALPFTEKLRQGRAAVIPEVTDDRQLQLLFPYRRICKFVWIYGGRLLAVTDENQITAENLIAVIGYGKVRFRLRTDTMDYVSAKNNEAQSNSESYSLLIKGKYQDIPSDALVLRDDVGQQQGLAMTNLPVVEMYERVVAGIFNGLNERYSKNRRTFWVGDSSKVNPMYGLGKPQLYNYLCLGKFREESSMYNFILNELNRLSNYNGYIQNIKKRCLVLKRTSNIDKIKSSGGTPQNSLFLDGSSMLVNFPVNELAGSLEHILDLPVLDDTNYKGNINIQLSMNSNKMKLYKELAAYDLQLIEEERTMTFFVLMEKNMLH